MALSKNTIKWINALQQKKYRQKYNKFVVEGDKIGLEILGQTKWKIAGIYALEPWVKTHGGLLELHEDQLQIVTPAELKKISVLQTPNQVLMVMECQRPAVERSDMAEIKALYLDGIQDPGNMGTILRIADWFGLNHVFCSEDCADLYNPKVVQASMGAFLRVGVQRIQLGELLSLRPDWPVLGAELDGEDVFTMAWPAEGILVIGNEGQGISADNRALIKRRLTIPKSGGAESLNAAVACGILCALWQNRP